jgi:hypothetical protein
LASDCVQRNGLSELQLAFEYGKQIRIFVGKGNVGGKTAKDLTKEFRGIEIGRNEQELRSWLQSRRESYCRSNQQ